MSVKRWKHPLSSIKYIRIREPGVYNYIFVKGSILQHIYLLFFRGYRPHQVVDGAMYMAKELYQYHKIKVDNKEKEVY